MKRMPADWIKWHKDGEDGLVSESGNLADGCVYSPRSGHTDPVGYYLHRGECETELVASTPMGLRGSGPRVLRP